MKTILSIILFLFLQFGSLLSEQNPSCDAENLQLNFIELMQTENLLNRGLILDRISTDWEKYKCDYLVGKDTPKIFVTGHLDFLVEELRECSPHTDKQDITDACLEAIKTFGFLHFLNSNKQNGLTKLAVIGQLFYDVKYVANDEMLDKYHWNEFKRMVEDLNEEWGKYTRFPKQNLSVCHEIKMIAEHDFLTQQASNCMEEILNCFERAYRPDFEMPCLEMESSLDQLFAFYLNFENTEGSIQQP